MSDEELVKKYVELEKQDDALKKLSKGYPIQYIIGNVDFYNTNILVEEGVLIPRFETEYLVDKTIKYIDMLGIKKPKILEIGTGTGCISIALKKNINCDVTSIDINELAINLAKRNAKKNNASIDFKCIDVHNFKTQDKYDVIISNPPYVKYKKELEERLKYEPYNAIFVENGIYFYDLIIKKFKNNLNTNYLLAFEIDDKEGFDITKIANEELNNCYTKIEKDYNNYERYVFISSKKM